jgi:predicted nucleic acid-binding protein
MSELAFFDTNVLLYADDSHVPEKRARAISLFSDHLRRGAAVVSLQVLQEYFSGATRKLGLEAEKAQNKLEAIARARIVRLEVPDVVSAIELHRLTRISFWDALIVIAARAAKAGVLYTEDLQSGAVVGGVKIVNPFAA